MKVSLLLCLLVPAVLTAAGSCLVVEQDQILASALAARIPAFFKADPAAVAGLAPAPGQQRVFRRVELDRIASRLGITLQAAEDICVERGSAVLERAQLESALAEALAGTGAEFRLLDFSRMPVPRGKLEFRRSGLVVPRGAQVDVPVIWRGRLMYSPTRSVSVWAKLTMSADRKRVTAIHDLPIGQPIQAEQLQLEQAPEFPFGEPCAGTIEEVAGKVPRRSLRRGETVRLALLALPREVQRGDTVEVEVESGAARLNFQGTAESGGRQGDRVMVKNPENGQRFAAQVEGKGKVSVNTERKSNARH